MVAIATRTGQQAAPTVWRLVRAQHGVISSAQLAGFGLSRSAIRHRIASGRLHPIHHGVYAAGRAELSRKGRLMAAVLACGPGALLSHTSAAELWGLIRLREPAAMVEISVPAERHPRPRGVRTHRRKGLRREDATIRDAIPLTSPARTLADLASRFANDPLEAAINSADKRGLIDPERLRRELDDMPNRGPGVARLRTLLDARTFTLTDSHLERLFLPLARRAGLPEPLTQRHENGHRVDFLWPDTGLVVETDGLTYHRTPAQQAADRVRDQDHAAAGLTCLRFTHQQVRYEPNRVVGVLSKVAARLSPQ